MTKYSNIVSSLFLAGSLTACQQVPTMVLPSTSLSAEEIEVYERISSFRRVIFEYVPDAVEPDLATVEKYLAQGVVNSIREPYSHLYVDDDAIKATTESLSGDAVSPGFNMSLFGERLYWKVIGLEEGSPAEAAGMRNDDVVLEMNGENMLKQVDLQRVQKIFSQLKAGQHVSMTVFRPSDKQKHEFHFVLESAKNKVVSTNVLEGRYGVLRYEDFLIDSHLEVQKSLETLLRTPGLEGIILDLRGNGGGAVKSAKAILEMLLPKGSIAYIAKFRDTGEEKVVRTEVDPFVPQDLPIMVTVNSGSASASEIVTGALQIYKRATVVGTTTYGKGIGQLFLPYEKEGRLYGSLKLTNADWYVSDGTQKIYLGDANEHRSGLSPDVLVTPTEEEIIAGTKDIIIDRAVAELKQRSNTEQNK